MLCVALALAGGPCARGGHAEAVQQPRGGPAVVVVLARELDTFDAFVCIHRHEAAWNDRGDPYWGGLQMDRGFMLTYGGDMIELHHGGLADTWTPAQQIIVADRAHRTRGFSPWPNTRKPCRV